MPFFKRSLAGPGYIILNVIRAMNIICLLAVVAASTVMLVKTFIVSKFFLFDAVSHVVTGSVSLALILTEISMFKRYTARNWPLLSPTSGFVTLGLCMIILGVSVLGNLNKEATSEKSLGTSAWQIVISSGIVTSILGVVNIFASYIFRHKHLDITARQVRAHGSTAPQKVYAAPTTPMASTNPSTRSRARSFHLGRSDTLPSYHTNNHPKYQQPIRNISAPVTSSTAPEIGKPMGPPEMGEGHVPSVGGVQRPDLAFHPAFQGEHQF